jgi:hypothetical protein
MAAHVSDWGDSLNQRRTGGKRLTMVMLFVGGGGVSVLDGKYGKHRQCGSFLFPPEPK